MKMASGREGTGNFLLVQDQYSGHIILISLFLTRNVILYTVFVSWKIKFFKDFFLLKESDPRNFPRKMKERYIYAPYCMNPVIMHKGYRIFRPADPHDYKSLQPFPAENLRRSPPIKVFKAPLAH